MIKLHGFYRSSASYRVRIALNLKGLAYENVSHDLDRGEHRESGYLAINPQGLLPTLEHDGVVLTQSLAILEYLDAVYPQSPLLPDDQLGRARVRALFQLIAADTHHVTSMRVSAYLKNLGHSADEVRAWQHHWLTVSFDALEKLLTTNAATGRFSHGDKPTLADIALAPQVYSAQRLGLQFDTRPVITRIYDSCLADPAFSLAHPDNR